MARTSELNRQGAKSAKLIEKDAVLHSGREVLDGCKDAAKDAET